MKAILTSCLIALVALTFSCSGGSGNDTGKQGADTLKPNEKPVFSENGKLRYIVEYKDGKQEGRVREFYADGKLYMDAIYKNGHRNGLCTHYNKNGNPFSKVVFVDGKKEGIESKYSPGGKLMAEIPYHNDKVQPGLKEYIKDGKLYTDYPKLVIREINRIALDGKYYLSVSLTEKQKEMKFYAAPQSDPESRELLKRSGDAGILDVPVLSSGFVMKKLILEAEYKTSIGNTMRTQQFYNLVVDR
jgi:hypothetical protein